MSLGTEAIGAPSASAGDAGLSAPIGLLAELTHRCPLRCPYCSNPLDLVRRAAELPTSTWKRAFSEARTLGVLQVHLSGGEPTARHDLVELVMHCADIGLYTNLITAGVLLDERGLDALMEAGLDHVQLSLQDTDPSNADTIAGFSGGHEKKLELGRQTVARGLPLTINYVVHRHNIAALDEMIELAAAMGARRIEIAHAQYHGWALRNRERLMPNLALVEQARAVVETARERHRGRLVIDSVEPDYYAKWPKPCCGGWGARIVCIDPSGRVLPCHAAGTIPGLEIWSLRQHALADIWADSPAFNAFRGSDWMEPPCTGCERAPTCKGGCRCQALAIVGRAEAADPACQLSPHHTAFRALAVEAAGTTPEPRFRYRDYRQKEESTIR